MKKTILIFAIAICWLCSCEDMRDHNGGLGGMWQLQEWRTDDDSIVANNEDGLYYIFHTNIVKFQDQNLRSSHHLAYFRQTADSIEIYHIVEYPSDSLCTPNDLRKFGVPSNGKFRQQSLNSKTMVLSGEYGTITFRKY